MTIPQSVIQVYKRTHWIIQQQTKGLSHADSLLQLPFRANCLNWVLGHILVHRDKVLELLGAVPVLNDAEGSIYQRESEPITDSDTAVQLQRLLEALNQSQDRLTQALEATVFRTICPLSCRIASSFQVACNPLSG